MDVVNWDHIASRNLPMNNIESREKGLFQRGWANLHCLLCLSHCFVSLLSVVLVSLIAMILMAQRRSIQRE